MAQSIDVEAGSDRCIEVDVGTAVPVAFAGVRRVLERLRAEVPAVAERGQRSNAPEWNRFFPGSVQGAPDLADLALSPSERRLHRESEQVFWLLNFAARMMIESVRESGKALVLRNTGHCDLPSLRAVMRAIEWARIEGLESRFVLKDWTGTRHFHSANFEPRRARFLATAAARIRQAPDSHMAQSRSSPLEAPVDWEGRYFHALLDDGASSEHRIAAAVHAIRACFFSTNYEGAMLAADLGLRAVEHAGQRLNAGKVAESWDSLDTGLATAAIEIDKQSLGTPDELRALFLRSIGVVNVYCGEHDAALETFAKALTLKLSPEGYSHLHMFRALMLIKRLSALPQAQAEAEAGLAHLKGRGTPAAALHEAWLRNVYALVHFQNRNLEGALAEEKRAMTCVGDLHDASATHLKINLISNVSVVQESAKRYQDAINTWRRFEKLSANWGQNFAKHHRYRLAALTSLSGEKAEAVNWFEDAYNNASQLGDTFHRQVIAGELGTACLSSQNSEDAANWFGRGASHAIELGDPFTAAQCKAGEQLARGTREFSEVARLALLSSTFPKQAQALAAAAEKGDTSAISELLPRAKSKLNRPFDLVNLM